MYKFVNGERVENLSFHHVEGTPWERTQFYWDEKARKVFAQCYNTETGEIKTVDVLGRTVPRGE